MYFVFVFLLPSLSRSLAGFLSQFKRLSARLMRFLLFVALFFFAAVSAMEVVVDIINAAPGNAKVTTQHACESLHTTGLPPTERALGTRRLLLWRCLERHALSSLLVSS